jgi:phosphomannomutase
MEQVKQYALNKDFVEYKEGGKVIQKTDVLADEIKSAIETTGVDASKLKKFKIVLDPANGMGSLYLDELFKNIPADLVKICYNLDGTFPNHEADPLKPKNLADLQKKVIVEKADLGISTDGDGDRIFFINEMAFVVSSGDNTPKVSGRKSLWIGN